MPSIGFYSQEKPDSRVSKKFPLDATEPGWEPEEPRSNYHKPWGLFAFIYETVGTVNAGGMAALMGLDGDTINNYPVGDVYNFPPIPDTGAGGTITGEPLDPVTQICNPDALTDNEVLQNWCQAAGSSNGCLEVEVIMPSLNGIGGDDFISIGSPQTGNGTIFPNGFMMTTDGGMIQAGVGGGPSVWYFRAIIFSTSNPLTFANLLECRVNYFSPPSTPQVSPPNPILGVIHGTYADAVAAVLACIKDTFGANYEGLGCTN